MKAYNKLNSFISLVCAVALLLSFCCVPVAADDGNTVTATTSTSIKQGSSGTCYVSIDSTKGLAALDVTVHFDPSAVKINTVYNSVSCTLYDSVKNTDNIQFSYIFDGKGTASKTRLFYFYYQVLSDADTGGAYFDITVGEAYDSSLNDVAVSGSQCGFTITETVANKSCTVYSSSTVSTSVEQEFTLSYRFSTYQIASGSAVITYDPEFFEVTEVTAGALLTNKAADINTAFPGTVYVAFAGTAYNTKYDLLTVKFKTLKNVHDTSSIVFSTSELYDINLNYITCKGYTTSATLVFDDAYVGDAPKMAVSAEYDEARKNVTAVIELDEASKLGAGDFILRFDPDVHTLTEYEEGFSPNFFNINDKQIKEGILKFSIISLEDIVTAEKVLSLSFDASVSCEEKTAWITVEGSQLADSLTEPILLNFIDTAVLINACHECGTEGVCISCGTLCGISGDADLDAELTIDDIVLMRKALIGAVVIDHELPGVFDADENFQFDIRDLVRLKKYIVGIQ